MSVLLYKDYEIIVSALEGYELLDSIIAGIVVEKVDASLIKNKRIRIVGAKYSGKILLEAFREITRAK
ncbi:hypothetical protein D0Z07_5887 [Hyphodiscus hymeniophilus]|uniref:Uncharacterized protein n=1 Tax=Hyphodiscus hymeniophilus TaxID=353542 RepID=A0A9P6VI33_9HELO|nr:hypothetical protein D0Z07_5887 [Hyphodiscus hymeniophilus]